MKLTKNPLALTVVAILIIGGSFYGGMLTQRALNHTSTASSTRPGGFGGGFGGGSFAGARGGAFGTVQSISGTTMTVSGRMGTTTVSLASNPTIMKSDGSQGAISDIATGDTVIVRGSAGSNGTVTATEVRINPSFGGGAPGNTGASDSEGSPSGATNGI